MEIVSKCPVRAGWLVWQPRASTHVLTVVCRATYTLRPGELTLATEQEDPVEEDGFWNDDPLRSLRVAADYVPVKPRAEVMIVGHAFAPGGQPTRQLTARLHVGEIDKSIEIQNDRVLSSDGSIQEGGPFVRMPLRWERAAGGPGTSNPTGIRIDARDAYGRRILPNLWPLHAHMTSATDIVEPIGFGPLASTWPTRLEKLGAAASRFVPGAFRERPLPDGIDLGYFNQAPADQQLNELSLDSQIVLENLHPEYPRLVMTLPKVKPAVFVLRKGAAHPQKLAMRPDTLWIDTDQGSCSLIFRGQLPIENADGATHCIVLMEPPGFEVTMSDAEMALGRRTGAPVAPSRSRATIVDTEDQLFEGTTSFVSPMAQKVRSVPLPFASSAPTLPSGRNEPAPPAAAGLPFQATATGPQLPKVTPPSSQSGSWPSITAAAIPVAPVSPWVKSSETNESMAASQVIAVPAVSGPLPPPSRIPAPAPIPVPAAPVTQAASPLDSPWAAGGSSPSSLSRETVGTSAVVTGAAVAVALPDPSPQPAPMRAPLRPSMRPMSGQREVLRLVYYDPESVPRIRRSTRFRSVLEQLDRKPKDRELDDPALGKDPMEVEDRREVFEVLAHGDVTDHRGIEEALEGAIRDDGKFVPPLVLVAGELEMPFDELETLKAAVSTASPLVTPIDETLKTAIATAKDFLQTPGLSSAPSVSEGLTTRIRDAFTREKKSLSADYLDTQMERALLAGRHYQRRDVLGETHLRFLLRTGEGAPVVGYIVEEVAKKLPMFKRFRGRMVAEVHLVEDQYETTPHALRVVAFARAQTPTRG